MTCPEIEVSRLTSAFGGRQLLRSVPFSTGAASEMDNVDGGNDVR